MLKRIVNLSGNVSVMGLYNEYKDRVKNENVLKETLKSIIKNKPVGFSYTWRLNDVRKFGVMYGDEFKVYEELLKRVGYVNRSFYFDAKWTKEVDETFVPKAEIEIKVIRAREESRRRRLKMINTYFSEALDHLNRGTQNAHKKVIKVLNTAIINRLMKEDYKYYTRFATVKHCIENIQAIMLRDDMSLRYYLEAGEAASGSKAYTPYYQMI